MGKKKGREIDLEKISKCFNFLGFETALFCFETDPNKDIFKNQRKKKVPAHPKNLEQPRTKCFDFFSWIQKKKIEKEKESFHFNLAGTAIAVCSPPR